MFLENIEYQGGVSARSVYPALPLPLGSAVFTVYAVLYIPFYYRQIQNVNFLYTVPPCEVIQTPISSSSNIETNLILAKNGIFSKSGAYCFALKVVTLQNPQAYCRGLRRAYISVRGRISELCVLVDHRAKE